MKTQDRTIRESNFNKCEKCGVEFGYHPESLGHFFQGSPLKQPEKQEIDVSHEVTADMADFNDVVYNRDCIIELQETVNKLLKE